MRTLALRTSVFALIAACVVATADPARATCGSINCFLVTGTQEEIASEGKVVLDVSYRYIVQDKKLDGTDSVGEVLTPKVDFENEEIEADHHREVSTQNTLLELDLAWGATSRLTFGVSLPLINERDHEHFDEVGTPEEFFTNDDGTSGFGDVRFSGRYALLVKSNDLLVGGLALKLPTGQYKLLDSEGEINEPTIQPGTGSWDAIAAIHWTHQWGSPHFESFVAASRKMNSENDLDYRMGTECILSAGANWSPGDKVIWMLQVNGRRTAHDKYLDDLVTSTGATFVNLTPGLRIRMSASSSLYAFAQLPVYQNVNDPQLAPRTGLLMGVSTTF